MARNHRRISTEIPLATETPMTIAAATAGPVRSDSGAMITLSVIQPSSQAVPTVAATNPRAPSRARRCGTGWARTDRMISR